MAYFQLTNAESPWAFPWKSRTSQGSALLFTVFLDVLANRIGKEKVIKTYENGGKKTNIIYEYYDAFL